MLTQTRAKITTQLLVSLSPVGVWASAALTTPTGDDIFNCNIGHNVEGSGSCCQCTDEKLEALDATPLVYLIVLSSYQRGPPNNRGGHIIAKPVYRLVKCGIKDAAAAEAFYAAGVKGWDVVFSCVLRVGETFDDRNDPIERVDELWRLTDDAEDGLPSERRQ